MAFSHLLLLPTVLVFVALKLLSLCTTDLLNLDYLCYREQIMDFLIVEGEWSQIAPNQTKGVILIPIDFFQLPFLILARLIILPFQLHT